MRVMTDFPERIRKGKTLNLGDDHAEVLVESVRWKNTLLLLKFQGYETPEAVSALTNLDVFNKVRNLPKLPEGKYYHHQLVGLHAWEGETLVGEVIEIIETGANDVYVIREPDGSELLLPAIPAAVVSINLDENKMEVVVLDGLRG